MSIFWSYFLSVKISFCFVIISFSSVKICLDKNSNTIFISQTGEGLVVNGEIVNSSTRKIVPKYIIYQKQSFFAGGERAVYTTQILKEKGEPLVSSTRQNLSKVLVLPTEISTTIQNCRILKVEYRLKVGTRKTREASSRFPKEFDVLCIQVMLLIFFFSLLLCFHETKECK